MNEKIQNQIAEMKKQTIGVEVEMNNITRQKAAKLAAEKAAAAREYNARRGIVEEEEAPKNDALSGIPVRPYCKGRAYDPNRYNR